MSRWFGSAPAAVVGLLGVDEGVTMLVHRQRVYADDTPMQMAISYLRLISPKGTALTSADPDPAYQMRLVYEWHDRAICSLVL